MRAFGRIGLGLAAAHAGALAVLAPVFGVIGAAWAAAGASAALLVCVAWIARATARRLG